MVSCVCLLFFIDLAYTIVTVDANNMHYHMDKRCAMCIDFYLQDYTDNINL